MSNLLGESVDVANCKMFSICLGSMTMSYLVSSMWKEFVISSVEAVQVKTKRRIPNPVSNLIAAICVSLVSMGILLLLYEWEKKVATRAAAAKEESGE